MFFYWFCILFLHHLHCVASFHTNPNYRQAHFSRFSVDISFAKLSALNGWCFCVYILVLLGYENKFSKGKDSKHIYNNVVYCACYQTISIKFTARRVQNIYIIYVNVAREKKRRDILTHVIWYRPYL